MLRYDIDQWWDVIRPQWLVQRLHEEVQPFLHCYYGGNFERIFHIEFQSEEEETMFVLRYGPGITNK